MKRSALFPLTRYLTEIPSDQNHRDEMLVCELSKSRGFQTYQFVQLDSWQTKALKLLTLYHHFIDKKSCKARWFSSSTRVGRTHGCREYLAIAPLPFLSLWDDNPAGLIWKCWFLKVAVAPLGLQGLDKNPVQLRGPHLWLRISIPCKIELFDARKGDNITESNVDVSLYLNNNFPPSLYIWPPQLFLFTVLNMCSLLLQTKSGLYQKGPI